MIRGRSIAWRLAAAAAVTVALAGQAAAEKINVAALTFVSSAPLFIAQDKGYYAAEGLEVEFKFFRAAQPVAVAVASGDADFGVTGLTAGFYNLAGKGALKVIGAQAREEKGFNYIAYIASKKAYEEGVTSVDKLKGRSVGMTQVGSTMHYMAGILADKKGWQLDDMKLVALQSVPNMLSAVKTGQVDVIMLPANFAAGLAGDGAKVIGWVHEETPWQFGGLFSSTKVVEERRATVEKFVRAYQKAATDYYNAFMKKDPKADEAGLVAIIEKYTKAKPEVIRSATPYIDPLGRLDVGDVHAQVAWYKARGMVDKDVEAKSFLDLGFIKGHYNVPK